MRRPLLFPTLVALALLRPLPAAAVLELYFVDPARSSIQVAGNVNADLGAPLGPFRMPLVSQPGGNSLVTGLSGQLLVDVLPAANTIRFLISSTFVVPTISGSWAPGPGGGAAPPAPAQLGVAFADDVGLGISGNAAVRDFGATFTTLATPLLPTANASVRQFSHFQSLSVGGTFDWDTNLLGLDGQGFFGPVLFTGAQPVGQLLDLDGGDPCGAAAGSVCEVVLPFDFRVLVRRMQLDAGLPINVNLAVSGEIVARNQPLPEPSVAVLLAGAALVGLRAARRARRL